jgi:hypothetical protein
MAIGFFRGIVGIEYSWTRVELIKQSSEPLSTRAWTWIFTEPIWRVSGMMSFLGLSEDSRAATTRDSEGLLEYGAGIHGRLGTGERVEAEGRIAGGEGITEKRAGSRTIGGSSVSKGSLGITDWTRFLRHQ